MVWKKKRIILQMLEKELGYVPKAGNEVPLTIQPIILYQFSDFFFITKRAAATKKP